jgi:hypothetical protein
MARQGWATALATALVLLLAATAQAQGVSWLDGPLQGWNRAGAAVPAAPRQEVAPQQVCRDRERPAAGPEEAQVAAAGWRLEEYWPAQRRGGLVVVIATAGYDGMCRPNDYNAFAFVDGRFAGSLAPQPMFSRTDGAMQQADIGSRGAVQATFTRYAPTDPLCCPSRPATTIGYVVQGTLAAPVLVPASRAAVGQAPAQLPRTGGVPVLGALGAAALAGGLALRRLRAQPA